MRAEEALLPTTHANGFTAGEQSELVGPRVLPLSDTNLTFFVYVATHLIYPGLSLSSFLIFPPNLSFPGASAPQPQVAHADFRISFDVAPGTPLGDGVEGSFFTDARLHMGHSRGQRNENCLLFLSRSKAANLLNLPFSCEGWTTVCGAVPPHGSTLQCLAHIGRGKTLGYCRASMLPLIRPFFRRQAACFSNCRDCR